MDDNDEQTSTFLYLNDRVRKILDRRGIVRPTPPQQAAFPSILKGENVLIIAPTGSGKTEAAILPLLSKLIDSGEKAEGVSILYITPMRALNRDLLKRLQELCYELGLTIQIRHGDTPKAERVKQSKSPPDLLVSTPETLQAILPGRKMRKNLSSLKAVVVDELHELISSKRGVQLAVGLERLREVAPSFQLICLSATIADPENAASFIFGSRPYKIIKADTQKSYSYSVTLPLPDEESFQVGEGTYSPPDLAARLHLIDRLIDSHSSTLIFVNSRTIAEMLGEKLSRLRNDVAVHHGSLPREERERVEQAFKQGQLRALVCTSTMELGIDIGTVELVIQYMSPRQATALLQRVGRSGHSIDRLSKGRIIAVSAEDLLESSAVVSEAEEKKLEKEIQYPEPLDVLAHQVAGYLMDLGTLSIDSLLERLRRAKPYCTLNLETLLLVVSYMDELRKIRFEREKNLVHPTRQTREYYFQNLSMIPDEIRYYVIDLATNQKIGILGEEFVLLHAKPRVHIILKGKVWNIERISEDRNIFVTSVEDPLAALPGWEGELIPVPEAVARRTGYYRELIASSLSNPASFSLKELSEKLHSEPESVLKVVEEIEEQLRMGAPVPDENLILVEGFQKYLILHLCFGERINRTFALTIEEYLSRKGLVRLWWADGYRVLFELTVDTEELDLSKLAKEIFSFKEQELKDLYSVAIKRNFPFPERIKTVAERFGAINRGRYISHPNLCSLPTRFEGTPIYIEALKETMIDKVDIDGAVRILEKVASGEIKVSVFQSNEKPTPIAYHLLYRYLEFPEAVEPESLAKSTVQRMKLTVAATPVQMLCLKCSYLGERAMVKDLPDEPRCKTCNSGLLSPIFYSGNLGLLLNIVKKRISKQVLDEGEKDELARLRRMADLVLSYGKKAVEALSVYGIGPQTASRILARMVDNEDDFYKSLLDAKIRFITTRPFWQENR